MASKPGEDQTANETSSLPKAAGVKVPKSSAQQPEDPSHEDLVGRPIDPRADEFPRPPTTADPAEPPFPEDSPPAPDPGNADVDPDVPPPVDRPAVGQEPPQPSADDDFERTILQLQSM